jgi:hypothetical protein
MAYDHARPTVDRDTAQRLSSTLDKQLRVDADSLSFEEQLEALLDLYEEQLDLAANLDASQRRRP